MVHSQKLPSTLAFRKVLPTPQMSQPAGSSFLSKAPIPQQLSEAEGHNPLLTRKDELLVKSQGGLWILGLKGKRDLPRLCRTDTGEHANHHSMHTACLQQHTGSRAAMLHHYRTLGEGTAPGGPAVSQAGKKRRKQTHGSS